MVADGSAYGGSKEMSLLYTNVAADLSAVFAKKIVKNRVLRSHGRKIFLPTFCI